ncbi:RidA family protein [Amycolatopsis tucumanensis]|uniref:RidA family protein n=1 Tax=Amycolatopsis tucumanensis TaxID=401106 RepID=A0ABP7IW51_9PSEU|nr:Rid family hydrolase [Amycolatopsis tucumanensis]MCF6429003.1 RidA family protein [Amycolatopsis tucumanensis]
MTSLRPVVTSAAPRPFGHYAQAVVADGGTIWVSAQLPAGIPPGAPVAEQVARAVGNVVAIVREAGGTAASIARMTLFVADIADWDEADAAYARVLGAHRPARAVVQVAGLHHGYRVAADAVALVVAP